MPHKLRYQRGHLTVRELYEEKKADWGLEIRAGSNGLDRDITTDELCRPGLLFAGFEEHFARTRLQVIGMAEWAFLKSLPPDRREDAITRLFKYETIPAIILAKKLEPFPLMMDLADEKRIPIFISPMKTTQLEHFVSDYLWKKLSWYVNVHADLVNIHGVGVLIGGKSGVGKSETALDLIRRGHALVADDIVKIIQYPPGKLLGMSAAKEKNRIFKNMLHVKSIGFINVFEIFGIKAVRRESPIDLYIELVRPEDGYPGSSERISNGDDGPCSFSRVFFDHLEDEADRGVEIPAYRIVVEPKKNAATLIEVLVLKHIVKLEGKDPFEEVESVFERESNGR